MGSRVDCFSTETYQSNETAGSMSEGGVEKRLRLSRREVGDWKSSMGREKKKNKEEDKR